MHLIDCIEKLLSDTKKPEPQTFDISKRTEMFISDMKHKYNIRLSSLIIESKPKQNMVRYFLRTMIEVYSRNLQKFMDNPNVEPDWIMFRNVMDESYFETRKIAKESGVPDLFVDKFDTEYKGIYELGRRKIELVCDSELFKDDSTKLAAMLEVISWTFDTVILACEMTVNNLNGELEKILAGSIFCADVL